ncbi:DUF357 domain-containing protein [Desulfurococcaceae archaeon MEX13E-LK6-19]|nr:DUF357 domain-containing protein [Desulfurococcaceae archaeon MEX13E-LK6-19]
MYNSVPSEDRVRAYIENVKLVINSLRSKDIDKKYPKLVEAAELYMKDAEYYLEEKKDLFTALACIAYAEGLIDSLRYLSFEEIEWESLGKLLARPKVLVAGSFEIIHPGHIYYLREAWKKGRVYVVVARDKSIEKFKKREPIVPEEQRLEVVKNIKYVYKAVLGDENDYLKPVEDIKPDIILLGPDQWPRENELLEELRKRGLKDIRIERLPHRVDGKLYSTSRIIEKIKEKYCHPSDSR